MSPRVYDLTGYQDKDDDETLSFNKLFAWWYVSQLQCWSFGIEMFRESAVFRFKYEYDSFENSKVHFRIR
jgi:hypothetical protein